MSRRNGRGIDDATAEDGEVQGAPVEAGRQVDRFEIDGVQHCDLMKTSKRQPNLRRSEQNNGLWPRTTSKTSWKDLQKYSPFRRDHVGDGVDEQVER